MKRMNLKRMNLKRILAAAALSMAVGACNESADSSVSEAIANVDIPGFLVAPKVSAVTASQAQGDEYNMVFVVGGGPPPMTGDGNQLNAPAKAP